MVSDTQYVFERSASMYYAAYGTRRGTVMRLACGAVTIAATTDSAASANVNFPTGFFKSGTKPIIVTSIVSPYNRRIIETINGLDGASSIPDARGFQVTAVTREITDKIDHIVKPIVVQWIAMGYGIKN